MVQKRKKQLNNKTKKRHIYLLIAIIFVLLLLGGVVYYNGFYNVIFKTKVGSQKRVKDVEAPVIIANDITITVGDKVDLMTKATVKDNYDKDVLLNVIGEYDNTTPGTYTITYLATDSSNNTSTKEITVTVKGNPKVTKVDSKRKVFVTSKGFEGYTEDGLTYINGVLIANKTYSLPSTYGNGLTKATQNAFNDMKAAALTDGIHLWICSGFRSYKTQKGLYDSYVRRDGQAKADTYSARAGYSEHQTGLAMDINYASSSFNGTPAANWLSANAYKFGFILRYPDGKTNETGYKFESWHYRYVGVDLATKLYNDGDWITLEDYFGITSQYSN